jgi:hypothetical protein
MPIIQSSHAAFLKPATDFSRVRPNSCAQNYHSLLLSACMTSS